MERTPDIRTWDDTLTSTEFWASAGRLESNQLDFKSGPPPDFHVDIAALSMTNGGVLVLGIDDDRNLTGCHLSQRIYDRIHKASHECGVEVEVHAITVDGVPVVLVAVPEIRGRIVTTPNGRLLRRVGSDNQPLTGDAMARFVLERTNHSAEEANANDDPDDNLDIRLINMALASDGKRAIKRTSVMRGLVDLGVAAPTGNSEPPTVLKAASLLFSESPDSKCNQGAVQLVRRQGVGPGPGPSKDRQMFSGNIPSLVDQVIEAILAHTSQYSVVVGTRREVWPEYPIVALREAVLNALAHRDYGLAGARVDITIWDDRIEIKSPGSLPGHITIDNIRDEHYSRNPKTMHVLKLLGLVEEYGEGVDRMFDEMEARLMEPPMITATSASVTVTFRNRFLVDIEQQAWLALLGHVELSSAERRILILARSGLGVTPRDVRAHLGSINPSPLLTGLMAKGLLVRVGERGGTRYVLSDEVVMRAGASGLEARNRQRQALQDELRRHSSLSTVEASALLSEDMTFVRHLLNDLVRAGLATSKGNTRARRYFIN
jgi:ATP-dependent DNA helicase RecG